MIDGFCRNAIESGLGIMRIFDALNNMERVKSTINRQAVRRHRDCAVCYTVDPKYPEPSFMQRLMGKKRPQPVFTDAPLPRQGRTGSAALGADMITIKDMSGLIPPRRVATLVKLFKKNISIPVDFHTHCTPGYGLASMLAAMRDHVDIVDTNCWYFAEGVPAAVEQLRLLQEAALIPV